MRTQIMQWQDWLEVRQGLRQYSRDRFINLLTAQQGRLQKKADVAGRMAER